MYWYLYKALKPQPRLSLTFSPRRYGNRWLLHEELIEAKPILEYKELDEASIQDSEIIVEKTWELIDDVLKILYEDESQMLDYIITKKIKIIVHLKKAGFTQNQLFQLARMIEDQGLQDLVIPRISIT